MDVELELLVAAADLRDHIVCLHVDVDLVDADEVKGALDPDNGQFDTHLVDHPFDFIIGLDTFAWHKLHRRLLEESLTLLLDFSFGHAREIDITDNIVLMVGVLLDV